MQRSPLALLIVLLALSACRAPATSGRLIELYPRLECVPVKFGAGISPPTRTWDYIVRLAAGGTAHVRGAEIPGGRIDVTFEPGGAKEVAANAGDYIYPADVRVDPSNERLYVRAGGHRASGGAAQTWLFEYDLRARRLTQRLKVDPTVLPSVCPMGK